MILRFFIALALVCSAVGALAQREKDKTIPTIILPIVNKSVSDKTQAESLAQFIRVKMLQPLKDRTLNVLSPALVMASSKVMGVDFEKKESWTPENLRTLADRHQARYLIGVEVEEYGERSAQEKPSCYAKVQVNVFDVKEGKFVVENKAGEFSKEKKQSINEIDGLLYQSEIMAGAVQEAMKEFLSKLPKAPKK